MSTFREANQVRTALKMKLATHSWYKGSTVCACNDGWGVVIASKKLDNSVRKVVPPVVDGVSIKTEIE